MDAQGSEVVDAQGCIKLKSPADRLGSSEAASSPVLTEFCGCFIYRPSYIFQFTYLHHSFSCVVLRSSLLITVKLLIQAGYQLTHYDADSNVMSSKSVV